MKDIKFEANLKNFTVELKFAQMIDPNIKLYEILALQNIIDPTNQRVINIRLRVIPNGEGEIAN